LLLDDLGVALTPPLSPREDLATAAGTTLPPLAWQDVNHRHRCGGNASINVDAIVDYDYKDDGSDINGNGGRNLALADIISNDFVHP
jgi:hypothetical protein